MQSSKSVIPQFIKAYRQNLTNICLCEWYNLKKKSHLEVRLSSVSESLYVMCVSHAMFKSWG